MHSVLPSYGDMCNRQFWQLFLLFLGMQGSTGRTTVTPLYCTASVAIVQVHSSIRTISNHMLSPSPSSWPIADFTRCVHGTHFKRGCGFTPPWIPMNNTQEHWRKLTDPFQECCAIAEAGKGADHTRPIDYLAKQKHLCEIPQSNVTKHSSLGY